MMRRFFGTSAVLYRVPPNAPAHVKQIPIPRTAKSTADINQYVERAPLEQESPKPRSERREQFMQTMLPSLDSGLRTSNPEGVWYHVERSRSGNLPIYTDYNNAGGAWTEIRKISGSVPALKNDLKKLLNLPKADIWVKNAAPVIVIKGNRRAEVKELLETVF